MTWFAPLNSRVLNPNGFRPYWHNNNGDLVHLDTVTLRLDEYELITTTHTCHCPGNPHHEQTNLTYVYSLLDLAVGKAHELIAVPPTVRDITTMVGFLIDSLPSWDHLDIGPSQSIANLLPDVAPDLVAALLTLTHLTQSDAAHTVRALSRAGHTSRDFITAAVLAGLSPGEAVTIADGTPPTEHDDLESRWRLLAALQGRYLAA